MGWPRQQAVGRSTHLRRVVRLAYLRLQDAQFAHDARSRAASNALPASGRHAEHASEVSREVALVREAAGGGDLRDGNARA